MSPAIETRSQKMAAMAVWRKQWKRHTLVAVVNVVAIAVWTSVYLLTVVHGRFNEAVHQTCKIPFTCIRQNRGRHIIKMVIDGVSLSRTGKYLTVCRGRVVDQPTKLHN